MTLLTAVQSAAVVVIGKAPTAVFSSTDQIAVEMRNLANDVAIDIARSHDWRDLTEIATFTGDGVTDAFPKPADYDRMVQSSSIGDPDRWLWGYWPIATVNEWMRRGNAGWISPGGWIILSGQFRFHPSPTGDAEFPYISSYLVHAEDGTRKTAFDRDDDTFVLDERLLTLGLIWRYRAQKGLDYTEDLANYGLALSERQAKDAGARVTRRRAGSVWPCALG